MHTFWSICLLWKNGDPGCGPNIWFSLLIPPPHSLLSIHDNFNLITWLSFLKWSLAAYLLPSLTSMVRNSQFRLLRTSLVHQKSYISPNLLWKQMALPHIICPLFWVSLNSRMLGCDGLIYMLRFLHWLLCLLFYDDAVIVHSAHLNSICLSKDTIKSSSPSNISLYA